MTDIDIPINLSPQARADRALRWEMVEAALKEVKANPFGNPEERINDMIGREKRFLEWAEKEDL